MFYVGQATDLRKREADHLRALRSGRHFNQRLQRSFTKYGELSCSFEIVLICEARKTILSLYEQLVLDHTKVAGLFNIKRQCVDSSLGVKASPERRAKIAAALTGIKRSDETKAKIGAAQAWKRTEEGRARLSAAQRGVALSETTRSRMSAAHRGRKMSPESIAKILATKRRKAEERGSFYSQDGLASVRASNQKLRGRKHSAATIAKMLARKPSSETRERLSIAHRGLKHTIEARANMSAAQRIAVKGRKLSPEGRAKLSAAHSGKRHSAETREKMRIARRAYLARQK